MNKWRGKWLHRGKNAALIATGVGAGYVIYKHFQRKKQEKADAQASAQQGAPPPDQSGGGGGDQSGGNYKREFQERYWDDGQVEERGWDEVLEERGLLMDELD